MRIPRTLFKVPPSNATTDLGGDLHPIPDRPLVRAGLDPERVLVSSPDRRGSRAGALVRRDTGPARPGLGYFNKPSRRRAAFCVPSWDCMWALVAESFSCIERSFIRVSSAAARSSSLQSARCILRP